jgi:hypothetical protein
MKPLIAVHACHAYADNRQAIRDTWFAKWGHLVDIRFFIGNPATPEESEVVYLDCPDTFEALGLRTWGLARWAKENGYTHVFKCDDDTYIHIPRLLASGFEKWEYFGSRCHGHCMSYAQGGAGYWLSGRALDIVANAKQDYWMKASTHNGFEDLGVGLLLTNSGIGVKDDPRFFNGTTLKWGFPVEGGKNNIITSHKCLASHMRLVHERLMASIEKTEATRD